MNMKTLIAAFAVAATTVASASIFNWTVTGDAGAAHIYGYSLPASSKWSQTVRKDLNQAAGAFGSTNYRWEGGVLQAQHTDASNTHFTQGNWYEVSQLRFAFKGNTFQTDIKWADVMKAFKDGNTYSKTFSDKSNNSYTLSITSLPEPTSGLLLLLGAGMLALRRKAVRA